jgi:hypothetical protein
MEKFKKVQNIILQIDELVEDGETMQYILEETGHDWQMLRQLVMTMPMEEIEYLIEERKSLGL